MKLIVLIIHTILGVVGLLLFLLWFLVCWLFGASIDIKKHDQKVGTLRWFTYTSLPTKDLHKELKDQVDKYTELLKKLT